jgi:ureidoglycolate dehydrogenase (NAD+)
LPIYAQGLRAGLVNGDPHPDVVQRHGASALVDADHRPGQVAGVYATDLSVELAREHGVGVVAVRRSTHYGSAGYYAMRAAAAGMIGVSTTNSEPFVIPYGGAGHALGTNLIALAAPTADGIFDVDMATSQVAINRIINAREEGRAIPEGWGVDAQGRTTTDPEQVFAAVPLGGYKGDGLAVLVEILSGVLPGAGVRHGVGRMYEELDRKQDVGVVPPRARPGPLRRSRPLRPGAHRDARRPEGDPARGGVRRGARSRRTGGARRSGATARGSRCPPCSSRRS